MTRLAILGASGHGKVVADTALTLGWEDITFFDDAWPDKQTIKHWNLSGNSAMLFKSLTQYDGIVVAIGNCNIRLEKQHSLKQADAPLTTLIHPSATVSQFATIGVGSVIMAGAVVNVDASIGDACIINTCATVDHDCQIADGVHIAPGSHLSGGVRIGERTWVGVGATIKQNMIIGSDAMVGAGALVINDIPDGITAIGVPAKQMEKK